MEEVGHKMTDAEMMVATTFASLLIWIKDASIRISALEYAIRDHGELTEEQWQQCLAKARQNLSDAAVPQDYESIQAFLRQSVNSATKKP